MENTASLGRLKFVASFIQHGAPWTPSDRNAHSSLMKLISKGLLPNSPGESLDGCPGFCQDCQDRQELSPLSHHVSYRSPGRLTQRGRLTLGLNLLLRIFFSPGPSTGHDTTLAPLPPSLPLLLYSDLLHPSFAHIHSAFSPAGSPLTRVCSLESLRFHGRAPVARRPPTHHDQVYAAQMASD